MKHFCLSAFLFITVVTSAQELNLQQANALAKLLVTEREKGMFINDGYALNDNDELIQFSGKKYLVLTKEIFTRGELEGLSVWKPEGYLMYKKKDLLADKELLDYSDMERITVNLLNGNKLKINEEYFEILLIDKKEKLVFYAKEGDNDILYRIKYN